ncbi:MAG: CPBP family intramembrane metalloprotease [Bacteroidales bacterium]|nr:CPBP family intramembrane metalloprotease [Bacteroidales bacterium]
MTTTKRNTIIGICITSFLFVCLMTNLFGLIHLKKNITSKWIDEIEFWLFLGLVLLTILKVEKTKLLLWRETKRKWYFYPLSVIIVFSSAVIVAITVPFIFKFLGLPINQSVLKSSVNFYCIDKMLMIFACLTAGVVEEFIFRGYLMPRLEILFKHGWLVVILSSLLFGIAHISGLSLVGIIVPILIGFVFSFHYYKYRNLIVLIVAHFLIDFASFITSC